MNKERIIEALEVIIEALKEDEVVVSQEVVEAPTGEVANVVTEEPKDLGSMKYNDLKKYAVELGVNCKGTKDEIIARITEKLSGDVEPSNVIEFPTPKAEESEEVDEFEEMAKEILEETDVEDVIEALADVDVKANKKNVLTKLAGALREGILEVEDADEEEEEDEEEIVEVEDVEIVEEDSEEDEYEDDEDEEDSEEEDEDDEDEEEDEEEEISSDVYTKEYDPSGYNDPTTMSEERADAIVELMEDLIGKIEEEEITEDAIIEYIETYATEDEIELLGEEYSFADLVKFYLELRKRTICDEGEIHEASDPYELNGTDMCCGQELKYIEETGKFICEVCGTEYEVE